MNNLSTYILEKLHLNKDIKIERNTVIDNMLEIADCEDNKKIREFFTTWVNDYSKKIYCYVSDIDYKYRYKDFKFDKIYISMVDFKLMKKAENLANQSTIYKKDNPTEDKVTKITLSQNDLAIYFTGGWNPIIFEKSTI